MKCKSIFATPAKNRAMLEKRDPRATEALAKVVSTNLFQLEL